MRPVVVAVALLCACGGKSEVATPGSSAPNAPPSLPPAKAIDAGIAAVTVDAAPAAPPAPPAPPKAGFDFIADIDALYRVVACGHQDQPLPALITHGDAARGAALQKVVDAHCKALADPMAKYRTDYFDKARAWFVAHEPKDLPKTVVYGFGGGDLLSALVAFPDATQISTVSLELSGDPRKIETIAPDALERDLAAFRKDLGLLMTVGSNLSTNLSEAQRNAIAAQLSSHLLGMSTGNFEPVSARFFAIDDDGKLHYFEKDEIDADNKSAHSLSGSWSTPAFAQSFQNVEVEYRAIGGTETRTFRHIAWNLGDDYLKKHPGALKHFESEGKVAICVKGASYLLWLDDFAQFRQFMIDHGAWMVTDSTGLAPNYAPASLVQQAYGKFAGAPRGYGFERLDGGKADVAMQKLWSTPTDKMPFRFGYIDRNGASGVIITTPKP